MSTIDSVLQMLVSHMDQSTAADPEGSMGDPIDVLQLLPSDELSQEFVLFIFLPVFKVDRHFEVLNRDFSSDREERLEPDVATDQILSGLLAYETMLLEQLEKISLAREQLEKAKREASTNAQSLIKKNVDAIALIADVHTVYQKKHNSIVNSWKAAELGQSERYGIFPHGTSPASLSGPVGGDAVVEESPPSSLVEGTNRIVQARVEDDMDLPIEEENMASTADQQAEMSDHVKAVNISDILCTSDNEMSADEGPCSSVPYPRASDSEHTAELLNEDSEKHKRTPKRNTREGLQGEIGNEDNSRQANEIMAGSGGENSTLCSQVEEDPAMDSSPDVSPHCSISAFPF
ncbi:hypothetical protein ANCCAN_17575 [Ancylostoma caninum]|uniref:Uncharacterized protein n=1 Tax=Ancylostoma caninum TaxID=29170 RepID=A0A368FWN8_ANCCA|nr:hypothetical protein ANCCAN_17575 [Ancylostoma caninum]